MYHFVGLSRRRASVWKVRRRRSPGLEALEQRQLLASALGDHLYISSTIPTTAAGAALGTITVQDLDAQGNLASADDSTVVQLFLQGKPGGARFHSAGTKAPITAPITATMNKGVATFTDVTL